jgi:RNA polymerase sigma-70 factor (ECF subfamily)
LFEILMRRHNQRLYRVVRAILRDEAETEDVLQDAYVRAFMHLDQFLGRARFSTWLTRIAVHEALRRQNRRRRFTGIEDVVDSLESPAPGPAEGAANGELRELLETSIDRLPKDYRTVFVLRDVEGLSTAETAKSLAILEQTVKTRLHRARRQLRSHLEQGLGGMGGAVKEVFAFGFARCDRLVAAVLRRLGGIEPGGIPSGDVEKATELSPRAYEVGERVLVELL